MQFFVPIILIIISGALFVTWIDPQYQEIKEKQVEKARFDETLAKTVEIREFRKDIQSKYNSIETNDIERLEKMLPTHIDNIRLILDVNSVANARQMTISDIRIDLDKQNSGDIAVSDMGTYGSVGFRFTVVTTYANFKEFLDDLATSLRVIDVTSVDIERIPEEDQFYRFNVGIKTYWLPSN